MSIKLNNIIKIIICGSCEILVGNKFRYVEESQPRRTLVIELVHCIHGWVPYNGNISNISTWYMYPRKSFLNTQYCSSSRSVPIFLLPMRYCCNSDMILARLKNLMFSFFISDLWKILILNRFTIKRLSFDSLVQLYSTYLYNGYNYKSISSFFFQIFLFKINY